ncbi:MAG TPA: hypothetical protein VET65_01555 [Candidatus Limnocylindrales bacterium]|nr:hypothetical protein [Candidatus Limnocylindrales bacterium]
MAITHSMHQIAPHTWTFEAPFPRVAPMKAHCRACRVAVALCNPEVVNVPTGNYIVRGACERCAGEVLLIVS